MAASNYSIATSGYTDLGAGPMDVFSGTVGSFLLFEGQSSPPDDSNSITVPASQFPLAINGSDHVYLKSIGSTLPAIAVPRRGVSTAPGTGTQSSVALTAADQQVLAANSSRKGFLIENDSSTTVYLLIGSGTASATLKSFTMQAGDVYEPPNWLAGYTGAIRCLSAAATGSLRVTEYT